MSCDAQRKCLKPQSYTPSGYHYVVAGSCHTKFGNFWLFNYAETFHFKIDRVLSGADLSNLTMRHRWGPI